MARITRVKSAQRRYEMMPVLDENGQQKQVPVTRNGQPVRDKHGRAVTRKLTAPDKTRPLPDHKCDKCGTEILPGQSYKHITPKSGPYGGRTRFRCAACPDWHVWEYSSSLPARLAEVEHNFGNAIAGVESVEDAEQVLSDTAQEIRDLAEEKEEAAQNMEDGFGHETGPSAELRDTAEQLAAWADEVEAATVPDFPEPEEQDCDCKGTGCDVCGGTGRFTPEEPAEEQLEAWQEEVEQELSAVMGNCP